MEKIAEQGLFHEPPGEGGSPVPSRRSVPKRRPKAGLILVILAGLVILWIPVNLYWLAFVPGSFAFTGLLFGTMVLLCGILGWLMPQYVRLLGISDDVVPLLAIADIGCLLSYGEAFPLTLIEMMAMELPIVTSQAPPFDELTRPAWGIAVDEHNTPMVADQIRQLLLNPGHRHTLGHAGREQVLENYTWDRVADAYLTALG